MITCSGLEILPREMWIIVMEMFLFLRIGVIITQVVSIVVGSLLASHPS